MDVPAKLNSADIKRFAQRAVQVESFKPPVAYWCYYWIVQRILQNGLHNADDAAKAFTTNLMDRLEEMKVKYADEDAITDDMSGQAYVEQFGLETFQRADNAVAANKATKQTADTFLASATFLELVNIWGTPSSDIVAKIKYAKFHALRIAKAINAGEDPNLSNPVIDPEPTSNAIALDPNDPEVRQINGADSQLSIAENPVLHDQAPQSPAQHQQPSVTDALDDHDTLQRNLASQSNLNESLHPSRAPSIPPPSSLEQSLDANVSNINRGPPSPHALAVTYPSPHPQPSNPEPRQTPTSGEYFPSIVLPDAPSASQDTARLPGGPISPADSVQRTVSSPGPDNPQSFYSSPPNPSHLPVASGTASPPNQLSPQQQPLAPPYQPPTQYEPHAPHQPQVPPQPQTRTQVPPQTYQQTYQPQNQQPPPSNVSQSYLTDDNAVLTAQKHAKFAISALNFEDVPTAVKELREALRSLGVN